MSREEFPAHPYERLRRRASPSFFRECVSAKGAEDGVAGFRSEVEEALEGCFHRTTAPLRPTANDAPARWLVDWGPIARMIPWRDLFVDDDEVAARRGTPARKSGCDAPTASLDRDDDSTALAEVCAAVRRVVWTEHCQRLERLHQFYLGRQSKQEDSLEKEHDWEPIVDQFHDAQLRLMQKIFLDVWTERDGPPTIDAFYFKEDSGLTAAADNKRRDTDPALEHSDLFFFKFISAKLTAPYLQPPALIIGAWPRPLRFKTSLAIIWETLIHQYTQSLCNEIQSLIYPPKLNPIAALVYRDFKLINGHDLHTRVTMLRLLVSRIRRWSELLVDLPNDEISNEPAQSKGAMAEQSEEQDAPSVCHALTCLLEMLKCSGAMGLLNAKDQHQLLSDNLSPCPCSRYRVVRIIRLIDASLQSRSERKAGNQTAKASKAAGDSKTTSKNRPESPDDETGSIAHSSRSASRAVLPPTALCIIKNCRNMGNLSACGMCERHSKRYHKPHPFNWEDAIPRDMQAKVMKRLRRRGIGPYDNIHDAIIQEARRMQRQQMLQS